MDDEADWQGEFKLDDLAPPWTPHVCVEAQNGLKQSIEQNTLSNKRDGSWVHVAIELSEPLKKDQHEIIGYFVRGRSIEKDTIFYRIVNVNLTGSAIGPICIREIVPKIRWEISWLELISDETIMPRRGTMDVIPRRQSSL